MNEYAAAQMALRKKLAQEMSHGNFRPPAPVNALNTLAKTWWGGVKDRASQLSRGDLSGIAKALPESIFGISSPEQFQAIQQGQEAWYPPFLGGMTVYHGSPHKFDRFSLDKIGTGEGAQAYGHGLYFAENPGVAKAYQMNLSPGYTIEGALTDAPPDSIATKIKNVFGTGDNWSASLDDINKEFGGDFSHLSDEFGDVDLDSIVDNFSVGSAANGNVFADGSAFVRYGDLWDAGLEPSRGNFYEVDIPDEAISKMLDWDAPLSEQPESVKKFAETLGFNEIDTPAAKGTDILSVMQMRGGGPAGASQLLKDAGIPGIRYFDGVSRAAGEGTRNIVLFDDSLAKILSRK